MYKIIIDLLILIAIIFLIVSTIMILQIMFAIRNTSRIIKSIRSLTDSVDSTYLKVLKKLVQFFK